MVDVTLLVFTGQSQMIKELIENHPLTCDDIKQLIDKSDQYVIPAITTHVKRCALVLYNTDKRENAEAEATTMHDNLVQAGFETKKEVWESALDIRTLICDLLKEVPPEGLSLLVVSIMSHGLFGTLTGKDGSMISINDILDILNITVPDHIPLVCSVSFLYLYLLLYLIIGVRGVL